MLANKVTWTVLKALAAAKTTPVQYVDTSLGYYQVFITDNAVQFNTVIHKTDPRSSDQVDFEDNYKDANIANTPVTQLDTDGAQIVRNKAAKKGWTFCSLPIEFETGRLSDTLFSQDSEGNARSYITLKAYNAGGSEVTTPGLLNVNYGTIVKTVIDFEPPFDFEIIGGDLRTLTSIASDLRLWIVAAPDIAAPYGSKEMGGGINLRYMAPGNVFSVDGRVSKFAKYSASLHTNKIRLIFKYEAGLNEALQINVQLYKE